MGSELSTLHKKFCRVFSVKNCLLNAIIRNSTVTEIDLELEDMSSNSSSLCRREELPPRIDFKTYFGGCTLPEHH
jgi:hypothetical protein